MMKNTGYILALCLTASGHVLAHDVWITGKQAENNITAEIGYGHNFPSKGTIPDRRNFFENPRIGTVAKLAMRQPFVLFKGLTFQKLCLPGAFRPGDHHNKMLRPGLCVVHASPQYL